MEDTTKCDWRNPIFRVYYKGKLMRVGTAKDLQLLFNQRHRALKLQLLKQVEMADDEQYQFEYQVELDAEYQEIRQATLDCAEEILKQVTPYDRPDDIDEEIAMFQDNPQWHLELLQKRRCRYRRYRLKALLPERIAAGMNSPDTATITYSDGHEIETLFGEVPDYIPRDDTPATGKRRRNGGIDWATKMTPLEEKYLEEKRKRLGIRTTQYF